MNLLIISASAIAVLSAVSLLAAWKGAVEGYETEAGFQEGAIPVPAGASHGLRVRSHNGNREILTR